MDDDRELLAIMPNDLELAEILVLNVEEILIEPRLPRVLAGIFVLASIIGVFIEIEKLPGPVVIKGIGVIF
jgi:hypothetical protein